MIDVSALKIKILELAFQGKLTKQAVTDGNVECLLDELTEKSKKTIKKVNKEDEPFAIPDSWRWIYLGDVCSAVTGRLDANEQDESGEYPFFTCGTEVYKTLEYAFDCDAILLGGNNASGDYKMHRYNGKFNAYQRVYVITDPPHEMLNYLYCVIQYWLPHLKYNSQGATTRFIKIGQVNGMLIPLPPMKEQIRIVDTIKCAFEQVDRIEELQSIYQKDADVLKRKLVDAGIQGKLTEQLSEDGNAEELYNVIKEEKKKLFESGVLKGRKTKRVNDVERTEGLFEIPDNWKWIRLGEVCEIFGRIGFRGYTKADIVEAHEGAITISPSNIDGNGNMHFEECTYLSWYKYEESPEIQIENEDIIIVKTGSSYGKAGIVKELPEKATINPQLAVLKYVYCNKDYLNYVLNCSSSKKQYEQFVIGAAIPTFSQEKLANLLIPLPPLAEQKRIVEKIEGILSLI